MLALAFLAMAVAEPLGAEEWYDAYERGLEALYDNRPGQALAAFERAIHKNPEPGTNVITYSTNRLDRYYPYLRLAEAYLLLADVKGASNALDQSLKYDREPVSERSALTQRLDALAKRQRATTPSSASTSIAAPTSSASPGKSTTGTLHLASNPAGADVMINGRLAGVTPLQLELKAGTHAIALRREGFVDETFSTRVIPGKRTIERRSLTSIAALIIISDPPGAKVFVDDQVIGSTDSQTGQLVRSGLASGEHRLRLSRPGHEDERATIVLSAGRPSVHTIRLKQTRRIDRKILALVGALAGGIVTLLVRRRMRRNAKAQPAGQTDEATTLDTASTTEREAGASAQGEPFGEYLLHYPIGFGGMATVYKAEKHGETCALKRPRISSHEHESRERFLREVEIGRTLHHPNIVRILEQGEIDGAPYFTMELVEGQTLSALLRLQGPLEPLAGARVIAQVAEALDYAHLKGVIHRDLKPSNIMIARDGTVKVMDYGIARAHRFSSLTITGAFLGTPEYTAPESAEDGIVDARSDLYSLGVVFYEALPGKRPFVGNTPFATVRKHRSEPPTPPSEIRPGIPRDLEAVILRLLRKEPSERYLSAEELLIALRELQNRAAQ
jgi:hypothetical protein